MVGQEQIQQQGQAPLNQTASTSQRFGVREPGARGSLNENTNDNNTDAKCFDTVINSIFSPTKDTNYMHPSELCSPRELPCFFEFLRTCTSHSEDDLVYGPFCLRHTNSMGKTYTPLGTANDVNMQPIFLKTAVCDRNMFLWSFLTNVSYSQAKDLISFMVLGTTESTTLAKFMMAVSEEINSRQNSEELQRLHAYLSKYCMQAIRCIDVIPDRDKIVIPITITESFLLENGRNRLLQDIRNKARKGEISSQTIGTGINQFYVPLNMLNILDQINILSYRMYCGIGRINLAPNVSITNSEMYVGVGLSIKNALNHLDIGKLKVHYPEKIFRLIKNIHGEEVHYNYDVLVFLALPLNGNITVDPEIFIVQRSFLPDTFFDVERLETSLYC